MTKHLCWVLLGVFLLVPRSALGCTIPVFRYALEKWELTPYEIQIYHRGPLPNEVEKELKKWEAILPKQANLEITRIDLASKLTKAQAKRWAKEGDEKQTPWMIVRYGAADPADPSAWRGPCTVENISSLVDSPARRAILSHLTGGASTVWVLLTSDDPQKDRAVLDLLKKELQSLEARIKLPVQSDTGPQIKLPIPLKVGFPILVIDRNRAEEAGFVRLLLGTEERLADKTGPMVFPMFGRGRVLGSLIEKEISQEQILGVCQFLCRECSCQVKELNPGIDMLMRADWSEAFDKLYEGKTPFPMPKLSPSPLLTETSVPAAAPVESVPSPVPAKSSENPTPSSGSIPDQARTPSIEAPAPRATDRTPFDVRFLLWIGIGVAAGLVLLTGSWVLTQGRRKQ